MKTLILTAAAILAGTCGALAQRSQDPPAEVPSCTILQARGPIVVDGRADEADWKAAPAIDFIFPWDDVTKVPLQSTVARMLWDQDHLYLLYECVDPYLDAKVTQHDGPVWEEDAVEIFATPNPGNLNAYFGYEMNARGTF
ncbi:MAG: carbohydrate-binding family 9-like protein, partial [Candidatus Latescibacterota bacterium]